MHPPTVPPMMGPSDCDLEPEDALVEDGEVMGEAEAVTVTKTVGWVDVVRGP